MIGGGITVIFVAFNSEGVIEPAVGAIRRHLPDAEVLVVDNRSTDNTRERVVKLANVRLVECPTNVGFGRAVNVGARAAHGELLLILNPDVRVESADAAFMDAMVHDVIAGQRLGIMGCRVREGSATRQLVSPYWPWRLELAWWIRRWFLQPREIPISRPALKRYDSVRWVSGAAFIVARQEFLMVGGFNEQIFLYCEDRDLSRAYREHGLPIAGLDAVIVHHAGGASSPQLLESTVMWCLLGLVEHVARWEGIPEARRTARAIWLWLQLVELSALVVGLVPIAGGRARAKRQLARRVRVALQTELTTPKRPNFYGKARGAFGA